MVEFVFFEAAVHSSQLPMRNRLLFSRVSRHNVRFFSMVSQENLLSRSGILATSILNTENRTLSSFRFDFRPKIYLLTSVHNSLMSPQTDCCFQSNLSKMFGFRCRGCGEVLDVLINQEEGSQVGVIVPCNKWHP